MTDTLLKLWRVFCIEENNTYTVWSIDIPTECPNIHGDRTIDTSKTRMIKLKEMKNFFSVYPKKDEIKSEKYYICASFKYNGSKIAGDIDYIHLLSNKYSNITSYDAKVIDKSNGNIIVEKTGMTNTSLEYIDLGTISNIPEDETILELHVKKSGGKKNNYVTVEQLIVYCDN